VPENLSMHVLDALGCCNDEAKGVFHPKKPGKNVEDKSLTKKLIVMPKVFSKACDNNFC